MSFNTEDLKWINEVNRHPHVYIFKQSFDEKANEDIIELIDNFTGETVYIFSENIYGFLNQLLDYYGFNTEE